MLGDGRLLAETDVALEPGGFTSVEEVAVDEGLVGVDPVVVDLVQGVELVRGEAGVGCAGGVAGQGGWVEDAALRVRDDVVDEAVLRVTLAEDFGGQDREHFLGDCVGAIGGGLVGRLLQVVELLVRGPPGGGTCDDPVVVVGVHLHVLHALATAGRASVEVAIGWATAVAARDQELRQRGGAVPGAVAPVDYGFRATECPGSGCVDAFVA